MFGRWFLTIAACVLVSACQDSVILYQVGLSDLDKVTGQGSVAQTFEMRTSAGPLVDCHKWIGRMSIVLTDVANKVSTMECEPEGDDGYIPIVRAATQLVAVNSEQDPVSSGDLMVIGARALEDPGHLSIWLFPNPQQMGRFANLFAEFKQEFRDWVIGVSILNDRDAESTIYASNITINGVAIVERSGIRLRPGAEARVDLSNILLSALLQGRSVPAFDYVR
jgi:hypothetical protein